MSPELALGLPYHGIDWIHRLVMGNGLACSNVHETLLDPIDDWQFPSDISSDGVGYSV